MSRHRLDVTIVNDRYAKVGERYSSHQDGGFWFSFGEIAQYFYEHRGRVAEDINSIHPEDGKATCGLLYQVLMELKDLNAFAMSIAESPALKRTLRLGQMKRKRIARKLVRDRIAKAERLHGTMPANVRKSVIAKMRSDSSFKSIVEGDSWGRKWIHLPRSIGKDKSKIQLSYVAWKKHRISRKRAKVTR